ncbi:MAG: FAD-dependent oxidoreductase [Chloroflexota bacterium]
MTKTVALAAQAVPVVAEADVVVLGGGPAGLAAAVAAARSGARTVLVERFGCLGGMATAGLVGPFMTSYAGDEPVVEGVFAELVERLVAAGGAIHPAGLLTGPYSNWGPITHDHVTPFDPEVLKRVAFELAREAGVDLLLHSNFVLPMGRLPEQLEVLVVANKSGLQAVRGRLFVDASGDGDLAARAGAPFVYGRGDGQAQPMSLFFVLAGVDTERVIAWVEADLANRRKLWRLIQEHRDEWISTRDTFGMYLEPRRGELRINTTRVSGRDATSALDLSAAEVEAREQVWVILRFLAKYVPGFERAYVASSGQTVGARESRHILGEYILSGEDAIGGRKFPDAIARCSYGADMHDPRGTGTTMEAIGGDGSYDIPYRCLLPRTVDNLLVAGRCLSGDHVAHASYRVMPFCFATGQAAGTAAALCLEQNVRPRDLAVGGLQQRLLEQGANLERRPAAGFAPQADARDAH